jgi:hypothetical protein
MERVSLPALPLSVSLKRLAFRARFGGCRYAVGARLFQDLVKEGLFARVGLWRRLLVAVVMVAVTGAAAHLGGLFVHHGNNGVVHDPFASHAIIVNYVTQPVFWHAPSYQPVAKVDPSENWDLRHQQ